MAEPRTSHIGRPLRRAGQYLDEQLTNTALRCALLYGVLIGCSITFAVMAWLRAISGLDPSPGFATATGVLGCVAGLIWLKRTEASTQDLRVGGLGGRVVADALERFRKDGYEVFHDVPGDGFNIDHVLVGPGGVFVIETKARRKRGNATVTYRDDVVLVDGHRPDRDPVSQARANRDWLCALIRNECALSPPMRAVVLFPGWFIEGSSSGRQVWVLNENALPAFVEKEAKLLGEPEVRKIAAMLATRNRGNKGKVRYLPSDLLEFRGRYRVEGRDVQDEVEEMLSETGELT